MNIEKGSLSTWKGDAVAVLLYEGEKIGKELDGFAKIISPLTERKDFTGKKGNILRVPIIDAKTGLKNLYLAGLGKKDDKNLVSVLRGAVAELVRKAKSDGCEKLLIHSPLREDVAIAEGIELGSYDFDKYKTKKDDESEKDKKKLSVVAVANAEEDKISIGKILACSQNFAKDIANEPANVIYPESLADAAKKLAEECGLECDIWDEKKIVKEKMGCLYAVGRGSTKPPRLIHLTYSPKGAKKKIVIVGKGLTFDSGGLDIKPSDFMRTMKSDKTGACDVLGIMRGVSKLKLKVEVHGIIGAAENMPGGDSFRPDDILTARNGKTVEIDNTDAEGRLVLADALVLASELKPDAIIDLATLTGACAVALGSNIAGLFSNNDELANSILAASEVAGEKLWRLPADDEVIRESMKSPIADIVNCASRYGGAIFAAIFLQEFVGDKGKDNKIPWAHFDIAGVDFFKENKNIYSKGASAFGVRTCLEYLMNI